MEWWSRLTSETVTRGKWEFTVSKTPDIYRNSNLWPSQTLFLAQDGLKSSLARTRP